jgi:hypothetical protein
MGPCLRRGVNAESDSTFLFFLVLVGASSNFFFIVFLERGILEIIKTNGTQDEHSAGNITRTTVRINKRFLHESWLL